MCGSAHARTRRSSARRIDPRQASFVLCLEILHTVWNLAILASLTHTVSSLCHSTQRARPVFYPLFTPTPRRKMDSDEIIKSLNLEDTDDETKRIVGITLQAYDKYSGSDRMMDKEEFMKMLDDGRYVNNKFEREKAFEFCDTTGDGQISRAEFVAAVVRVDPREIWRRFFNDFDKDRNGTISEKELKDAMKKLRDYDYDTATIERYLNKHDKNKDGRLDYNEFIIIFSQQK